MSCFDVKILDPNINTIEIETCIGDQPSSIDVITYDNTSLLEVNHCVALLPSELNDLITVKDILAGSGISVSDSSGIYTVSLSNPTIYTSGIVDFLEGVQDIIGNSGLVGGSYININYNDTTGFTTISATGLQPSGNYSVVGHTHSSSNITDFNSAVSGLLPVKNIVGNNYINVTNTSGVYTIASSGLQPSGNYSVVGHTHSSSDISNFNSSVSGLLPNITGTGYVLTSFNNNLYTISVSGLQPSGNYSVVGHTHTSSQITDFNSAVSGLIPPSNFTSLSGVSGVVVTNSGTNYYVGLSDPTIQLADITDLSSNARTFLLTPSSTNLSTLISDETGSGSLVFNTSPIFSGIPIVPTASSGTNTQQIASTQFVRTEISNLVNSAPSTLDTLNELATALGNDPNFATTVTNSLANKANLSGAIFTGGVTIPNGTGNFNSLTVNSTGVSLNGHTHSYTDITNFASGVDAALSTALVAGTGIYLYEDNIANTLTISTTGVSLVGHSHTSSSITDFNSAVSGLLPVKDIVSGTGISVSSSSGIYTINSTGSGVSADQAASIVTTVFNKTASTINKGSVVYINGGQGDQPTISLAIANGEAGSSKTYGITYENITSMNTGKVVVAGALTGFNTDQFNPTAPTGDVNGITLYLSPTVSGAMTTTKPLAPNHLVSVGTIVRTHQNAGVIEVRIQNGFELGELHNVAVNGVPSGSFLQYNGGSGLWMASTSGNFTTLLVNGTGVSVSGHTHVSANITNFDVAVSGYVTENILPPNVTIYSSSGDLLAGSSSGIHYIYVFKGNAINYALVLPSANNKSMYTIKNQTSGTIYIKTSNSETIDDYQPSPLPSGSVIGLTRKYSSISLVSDQDSPIPQWIIV